MKVISNNNVGLAGEFAVLSKLVLLGYDASFTLGNTKSVDILISDPQKNRMLKLEVKTALGTADQQPSESELWGETFGWPLGEKVEGLQDPSLFYCFVNLFGGLKSPRFFIVPSTVVANYTRRQHRYWHRMRPKGRESSLRKFRLAVSSRGCKISTPLIEHWENNWDFRKTPSTDAGRLCAGF